MFYLHSLLSPRPALRDASDRQHAVRMEGLRVRRAVDADQALSQEEQRDDNVGNTSACGGRASRAQRCDCLTASRVCPVPLQVCPRNGADRQVFQPVHRLTARHSPRASAELCSWISTRVIKTFYSLVLIFLFFLCREMCPDRHHSWKRWLTKKKLPVRGFGRTFFCNGFSLS